MNYEVKIINPKLARRIGLNLTVDANTARNLVERGDAQYIGKGPQPRITATVVTEDFLDDVIEPLGEENLHGVPSGVRDSGFRSKKPAKIPNSSV